MSDQYDEIELIRRIQKGDESALTIIISEYHSYVVKIVYSILGSYAHKVDLQGVVNQIFFTLWQKARKFDPSKSITLKEDGSGWKLDKGETLVFQAQEYKSELHRLLL